MRGKILGSFNTILLCLFLLLVSFDLNTQQNTDSKGTSLMIKLPKPGHNSKTSVERSIKNRRSIRSYKNGMLSLKKVSQILWAAQGITDNNKYRSAPSAGALYPIEIYVIIRNVKNVPKGVYKYRPNDHCLCLQLPKDNQKKIFKASNYQECIDQAQIILIFAVVYDRVTVKYGKRGIRYTHMEVGHSAQNVYLQCESLGLGTVTIGAFFDDQIKEAINAENNEDILYLMPVGRLK